MKDNILTDEEIEDMTCDERDDNIKKLKEYQKLYESDKK